MTLLRSIRTTSLIPLFYFSSSPTRTLLPSSPIQPPPPQPSFLVLNSYLSLFLPPRETKYCCCGNSSQRGERRGERKAYETSRVETEAYIWPFPVCGLGGRAQPFYEHCVCLSLCDCKTDGVTDKQTEWDGERTTYRVWSAWYWSLDLAAAVLLLLARPAFCPPPPPPLHNNTQHTHYS